MLRFVFMLLLARFAEWLLGEPPRAGRIGTLSANKIQRGTISSTNIRSEPIGWDKIDPLPWEKIKPISPGAYRVTGLAPSWVPTDLKLPLSGDLKIPPSLGTLDERLRKLVKRVFAATKKGGKR